jgi:hypothetical protein
MNAYLPVLDVCHEKLERKKKKDKKTRYSRTGQVHWSSDQVFAYTTT